MYYLFGNKWLSMHGGPLWKVETTEQGSVVCSDTVTKSAINVGYVIFVT